ncbi:BrnA antitoxin family protein [Candidatus Synechococcus calcipolaris G9]|uniref:BrnA antitoxin family protein n=1 Tax=Candidatus Synechococcus calcipolaris G9 TaxID=1497997 RepID=A0ABT6EZJ9_9SYNE|nr:BrnA antitoxin family protein [Candidatus Synechococcus calcipolaris]MDG2991039.1 BrnA antitoxin family protein [Candidatus Synechococcus calcipolaris G9]
MKVEYDFSQAKQGAVIPQTGKTRITIYIDDDVLETFRERSESAGKGYQTMMNEALRQYLEKVKQPLDEETLRRVLQEELQELRAEK